MKQILLCILLCIPLEAFADTYTTPPDPASQVANWVSGVNSTPIANTTPLAILTPPPTPTGTPGPQKRIYITDFTIGNASPTTSTDVHLLNGGTLRWSCPAAQVQGGCSPDLHIPLRGSPGASWSCQVMSSGASITCAISGYQSEN